LSNIVDESRKFHSSSLEISIENSSIPLSRQGFAHLSF
jgi:hypothetical protein